MKFPRPQQKHDSRRAFLGIAKLPGGTGSGRLSSWFAPVPNHQLIRASRPAMACDFEILFPASRRSKTMVAHQALNEIDRLEAQLTVYRDDSEVAIVNREAFLRDIEVEVGLFDLLSLALDLYRQTSGAFDFTAGALARCWGFHQRRGRIPEPDEIEAALERVGGKHVHLDPQSRSVRFTRSVEINLGAIGKGFALDRAGELLRQGGVGDSLLHAGHSSVLALGSNPANDSGSLAGEATERGWRVGVRDPSRRDRDLAIFRLSNRALSTSGIGEQSFLQGGKRFGHILDGRTGRPAEGRLSATAIASSAAEADALSTAFFVMSTEEVEQFCRRRSDVGALLVDDRATEGDEPKIRVFGLEPYLVEAIC